MEYGLISVALDGRSLSPHPRKTDLKAYPVLESDDIRRRFGISLDLALIIRLACRVLSGGYQSTTPAQISNTLETLGSPSTEV